MISPEDVRKLASLARINISPEEEKKFAGEIDSILGYVAEIKQASADAGDETAVKATNVLRTDDTPHESGVHTQAILDNAPQREGDYIRVKKILS